MNYFLEKMKQFDFLNLIMGSGKQDVEKRLNEFPKNGVKLNFHQQPRKSSYPTKDSYADSQLGRLRSIDHRLSKGIALEQPNEIDDGLYLNHLLTATSFIFLRKCEKPHGGFGFYCDLTFREEEISDFKLVIQQMTKPRRKPNGLEDGPLDIFDISPDVQRQILGVVPIKRVQEAKQNEMLEGAQVFCVKGLIGLVLVKDDWTDAYEIKNSDGETIFLAQRFNRISGGYEFQIYSFNQDDLTMLVATMVRLEFFRTNLSRTQNPRFEVFHPEKVQETSSVLYYKGMSYNHPTPGTLFVGQDDTHLLEKLDVLANFNVFIIQRKMDTDCFSSKVTHEIMDHRRNVILTAHAGSRSLFSKRKKNNRIAVKNRRNVKLFGIVVEPTNNTSEGSEATIIIQPGKRIAHIEKYGGLLGPPSFEIFNIDGNTAFTSDPSKKSSENATSVEYDVSSKIGRVATILMKSGLNFILSTEPSMRTIERATLISAVLAMDLLQTATRTNEAPPNEYTSSTEVQL